MLLNALSDAIYKCVFLFSILYEVCDIPKRRLSEDMCKNALGSFLFKIKIGHGVQTDDLSEVNVINGLSFLEQSLIMFYGKRLF
mmetsp:Transcript_15629/g.26034  ORF Transcript_15629/g.26034 Transcript_15629/m.26034 type:complete len:84 (-) Transcript_15629:919-1170(-)